MYAFNVLLYILYVPVSVMSLCEQTRTVQCLNSRHCLIHGRSSNFCMCLPSFHLLSAERFLNIMKWPEFKADLSSYVVLLSNC
jgi:hypothetical protein